MIDNTCCFIGHRTVDETDELKRRLRETVEKLINEKNVSIFLFGSKSRFNDLCYRITSEIRQKYPHIKRVYVWAEYPVISEDYKKYLLKKYEDTYYPEKILNAGRAVYIERNREMIKRSRFCVTYYKQRKTDGYKSGTEIAFNYAASLSDRVIINTAEPCLL